MWYLGTWFSGRFCSVRIMVGLNLRGLFQPKQFCDSITVAIHNLKMVLDSEMQQFISVLGYVFCCSDLRNVILF